MARKKSSFYHTHFNHVGLNEQRTAEILGVSVEDVKRWDTEGAPPMAERLLLLWDSKHVRHEGWDGFLFSRGVLRFKNRRWTPAMLKAMHDEQEEMQRLQIENSWLKTWKGLLTVFVDKLVDSVRHHKARR